MSIPLLDDYDEIPLRQLEGPSKGRLNSRFVRTLFANEITYLDQQIVIKSCGCFSFRSVTASAYSFELVDRETRFKLHCFQPILAYCCVGTILTTATVALGYLGVDIASELTQVLIVADIFFVAFCTMSCLGRMCCPEDLCDPENTNLGNCCVASEEYKTAVAKRLTVRKELITQGLSQIPRDQNFIVPPELIAKMLSQVHLRESTLEALLDEATAAELEQVFTILKELGVTDLSMHEKHRVLKTLILAPPDDAVLYQELAMHAMLLMRDNDDIQVLRNHLPANDPRLQFVPLRDTAVVTAPKVEKKIPTVLKEPYTIVLAGKSFVVEKETLREASGFFESHMGQWVKNESSIQLHVESPFKAQLERILGVLSDPSVLWTPLDQRSGHYDELIDCAHYYQFGGILLHLGTLLVDAPFTLINEKVKFAGYALLCRNFTEAHRKEWEIRLFKFLINDKTGEYVGVWLDFVIKHNLTAVLSNYTGYILNMGSIPPKVLLELLQRKDHFELVQEKIRAQVIQTLSGNNPGLYTLFENRNFVQWCAALMKDPNAKFLSNENFKGLWESEFRKNYPLIADALKCYAQNPLNKKGILTLWSAGTMPSDLVPLLPM